MTGIKLSVAIPYFRRLDNVELAFEALAHQTIDRSEFEVVVGAMEYCTEYISLCRQFSDRIDITSVVTARSFDIPRARNLCLRQARGRVVVQTDADTLLPPTALQNLYERHFSFAQKVCVVGQVVGYGNNNDGDVEAIEARPYAHYAPVLDELAGAFGVSRDPRFGVAHVIPWAFAWTGLIALPMDTVREHDLYFDEDFRGWGVDDLEWGYRICASGTPIVLREDVYALHVPHIRDSAANRVTEGANYHRFLRKWPSRDVELAHAIGDMAANSHYLDFLAELKRLGGDERCGFGTIRGTVGGSDVLVLGADLDDQRRVTDRRLLALFDDRSEIEVLPLVGVGVPYEDASVDECRVLLRLDELAPQFREAVRSEAHRVARRVVWQAAA